MKATGLDGQIGGVTDHDSRPWWQDGVLGRAELGGREDPEPLLEKLGNGPDAMGLDGVIVSPDGEQVTEAVVRGAHDRGLRAVIDLNATDGQDGASLGDAARRCLEAGADGVALEIGAYTPPPTATVTRLYGAPSERDRGPLRPTEAVRQAVEEREGAILVGWRPGEVSGMPPGPHLVIETTLSRKPWRAAALGQSVEQARTAMPAGHWPGYAMGAPRRGPFAVGLAMDDAIACSAALHLTLRGTPCIELGKETELPHNDTRRAWYRRLIDLRRAEPALHRGDYRPIRQEKSVLGYLREYEAERLVVLLNLGRRSRTAHLPTGFAWTVLLSNGAATGHRFAGGEVSLPGCGVLIARAGTPQSRSIGGSGQRRATGP